ncbi:cytochrome P450 [Dendrothele bispora CBS 962.96]|uniref:Cytochrome P450 n=1 Tax=Dendrothele bispora (strain CBS 962.96) TaxID=1314807 RepID=A0A4S8LGH5_DENBC|nr:cytochrome P450 [Dendrothele bispora CBS 962.96]
MMDTPHMSLSVFSSTLITNALIFSTILGILSYVRRPCQLPCPPGPKGYWLLGLAKVPLIKPWLTYIEWGKKYGDVIHFTRFGRHYVVINSLEAANGILERQAQFTSDRPTHSKLDQIADFERTLATIPYGNGWRAYRKLFHQNFRAKASIEYRPIEVKQVHKFLNGINSSKMSLRDQVSTLSQIVMFDSVYGLEISTNKDDMSQHARDIIELNDLQFIPGWEAFKGIPFIDLLPSWFPGGHYRIAHEMLAEVFKAAAEGPWGQTLKAMEEDENHSSLIAKLLSESPQNKSNEEIELIKNMGMQAVAAAADTTMSAICTFFLAMSLYPDVQLKAQQELDTVLGRGQTPTFDDRSSLPYVEAIYREVMRWHPALPVGLPHGCTEDIYYKGYIIPKGTVISANIWAMTHDESKFDKPDEFIPERHLDQKSDINSILAYGFGRRICAGRYMADDTTWFAIASILATKSISSLPNENVEDYFSDGSFWIDIELNFGCCFIELDQESGLQGDIAFVKYLWSRNLVR